MRQDKRFPRWAASAVAVLAAAGCASGTRPVSDDRVGVGERGTLFARVVRGPVSPVETGGGSSTQPAPGLELLLTRDGRGVASAVTDLNGEFRLGLSAGVYSMDLADRSPAVVSKDLPAVIAIEPDRETRIEIRLDTGLR